MVNYTDKNWHTYHLQVMTVNNLLQITSHCKLYLFLSIFNRLASDNNLKQFKAV